MKNRIIFLLVVFCLSTVLVVFNLFAQASGTADIQDEPTSNNRRIGSSAATELLIPVGARGTAMGGANMAVSEGVESIHWNPAGLARVNYAAEAMVSSMAYIADIRMNYAAVGLKFEGVGSIALSIRALDFGDVLMTTNDDPYGEGGRTYSPGFITVGLTYARQFTDAITFGLTTKVISEKMARATGSGVAFDLGVQYHGVGGIQGLNLGVALKNYGPAMSFSGSGLLHKAIVTEGRRPEQYFRSDAAKFELPSTMEMGASYVRQVNDALSFVVNSAFVNNNLALNSYTFGGEVAYNLGIMTVMGRGGYAYTDTGTADESIFGPTLGFGIFYHTTAVDIIIDYAWRQVEYFDNNSVFSFKFGF